MMAKVLINIPDDLIYRSKIVINDGERSAIITRLFEEEINKREEFLYQCALQVDQDEELNTEMQDWGITISDGLQNI